MLFAFMSLILSCRKILSLPMVKNEVVSLYCRIKSQTDSESYQKVMVVQAKAEIIQVVFIMLTCNPMSELLLQQARRAFQELFQQLLNNLQVRFCGIIYYEMTCKCEHDNNYIIIMVGILFSCVMMPLSVYKSIFVGLIFAVS